MGDDAMLCDLGGCGHEATFFRRYYHQGALMRDEVCADHVNADPAYDEGEYYALVPIHLTDHRTRRETARWMLAWLEACAKFECPTEAHFRLLAWSHLGLPSEAIDALVRDAGGGDSALAGPIPARSSAWDADLLARSRDLLLTDPTTAASLRSIVAMGVGDEANYRRALRETLGMVDENNIAHAVNHVMAAQDDREEREEREERNPREALAQQIAAMDTALGKMRSQLQGLDAYFPTLPGASLPTETFARLFVTVRDPRHSSSTLLSLLARALREWVAFLPMHPNVYEAWLLREAERDWGDAEEGKKAAEKLRRAVAKRVPTETAFRMVLTDCPWMSEEDIGVALASVSAQKGHGQKTPHDPLGAERRAWNEREQALLRDLQQARETIRTLQGKIEAKPIPAPGLTEEQTERVAAAFWNGLAHAGLTPNEGAGPAWDKVLKSLQDLSLSAHDHVGLSLLVRDAILASQVEPPSNGQTDRDLTCAESALTKALHNARIMGRGVEPAWTALIKALSDPKSQVDPLATAMTTAIVAVQEDERAKIVDKLQWHPETKYLRTMNPGLDEVLTVITGRSRTQRVMDAILEQLSEANGAPGENSATIFDLLPYVHHGEFERALADLVKQERALRLDDGTYALPPSNARVRAEILKIVEAAPDAKINFFVLRKAVDKAFQVHLSDRAFDCAYLPIAKTGQVTETEGTLVTVRLGPRGANASEQPTHMVGLPAPVQAPVPESSPKAPASPLLDPQPPAEESPVEAAILKALGASATPQSFVHLAAARAPGTTREQLTLAISRLVASGRVLAIPATSGAYYALPRQEAKPQPPAAPPAPPTPAPAPPASLAAGSYVPSRDRSPAGPAREGEEVSVAALADGEFVARVKLAHEGVTQPLTAWLGAGTDLVLTWGPLSIASGRWNPETATVVEWQLFPGNPLVPQGVMTWDDAVNVAVLRLLAALRQHRPPRRWNEERAKGLLLIEAGRAMAQGSPRQAVAWQNAIANDESWQSEAGFSACFQRLGPTDTSLPDALRMIYAQ